MKKSIKTISSMLVILLITTLQTFAVSPLPAGESHSVFAPVKASAVEIVKKVTVKANASKPAKAAATAATGVIGAPLPNGGTRYAIVIGINDYPGTSSDLDYAVADAESVIDTLMLYGFQSNNIIVLEDAAASGTNIYNAVLSMKSSLGAQDELVFFYSGHGAKGRADDGDTRSTDQSIVVCNDDHTGFQYIWDGQLQSWFGGFPTSRVIFAFDSCLSGGMSVLKDTGRVVNMACTATGYSYESDAWGGGHGQFTYYFIINGLALEELSPADVKLKDGQVSIEEAFDYAKAKCVSQTPTIADVFKNDLLM